MRIIVKVGTGSLAQGGQRLSRPYMADLARQIARLRELAHHVILVSSGAVFAGREALGESHLRKDIPFKQTLAAVGQVRLLAIYEQLFGIYGATIAQALLTRADLANRERYLNARNTLLSLLELDVVPIINENDVVGVEEIRIGDNDNLSALVANLVDADLLVMLTDQEGLYTADPRTDPNAKLIPEVACIDEGIQRLASSAGSDVGTGGMATKIEAARMATASGTRVVIASAEVPDVLVRLVQGECLGTAFSPPTSRLESRKRWILAEPSHGAIQIDAGASAALRHGGKSLLPVGVTQVDGDFVRGHTVRILDPDDLEIARGIAHYDAKAVREIKGRRSEGIGDILGYDYGPTVVHRDDLVLLQEG
jgi:glutamate 5-kinase